MHKCITFFLRLLFQFVSLIPVLLCNCLLRYFFIFFCCCFILTFFSLLFFCFVTYVCKSPNHWGNKDIYIMYIYSLIFFFMLQTPNNYKSINLRTKRYFDFMSRLEMSKLRSSFFFCRHSTNSIKNRGRHSTNSIKNRGRHSTNSIKKRGFVGHPIR